LIKTVGGIVAISAGQYHSLLLDSQGRVFSFGNNESGQLGLGDNRGRMIPTLIRDIPGGAVSSIVSIAAAVESSLISDTLGRVFGFGENNYKQLGPGPEKILTPTLIEGLTI
jgi:alpha-tubulin suppressor-like RCC1 family protein